jgi:hypothetical protein
MVQTRGCYQAQLTYQLCFRVGKMIHEKEVVLEVVQQNQGTFDANALKKTLQLKTTVDRKRTRAPASHRCMMHLTDADAFKCH